VWVCNKLDERGFDGGGAVVFSAVAVMMIIMMTFAVLFHFSDTFM
jgi:hypothetical protein